MKKLFGLLFAILLISGLFEMSEAGKPDPSQPVFVQEFLGQLDYIEGRLTQLADAMPQEIYNWRPGSGIRSVGEVYLHCSFANFMWNSLCGGSVPEDVNFVMDPSKIHEWDTQTTDKTEIIAMMKRSFNVMRETANSMTAEDLEKEVNFFDMKFSLRNFLITGLNHLHEHLGQSIAYARMNGVTPPWSVQNEGSEG
ncbi:MAG: hypothetical protein Kow0098_04430 [Ignavibacteriaceae bacterium]